MLYAGPWQRTSPVKAREPVRLLAEEEAVLLLRLHRRGKYGASHLLEVNLLRGLRRNHLDRYREALRILKRDGILAAKSTKHGPAVFIPSRLGHEVLEALRKWFPDLQNPPWL